MNKRVEVNTDASRGILDNIDKLSNIVQEIMSRLENSVRRFRKSSMLISLIVNRITQSSVDLQRISDEALHHRLAVEPFIRLTGFKELRGIFSEDTEILAIRRIDDHTLNFRSRVTRTAPDTGLFEAYGFSHYDNLDSTPRKLVY